MTTRYAAREGAEVVAVDGPAAQAPQATRRRAPPAVVWALSVPGVSVCTTFLGLAVAALGAAGGAADASSRFWATAFFIVLLWPVGLGLVGRFAGRGAQLATAALLLLATGGQQAGRAPVPLPAMSHWTATLEAPGDAIRQRILIPPAGDRAWQRAWARAAGAAVWVCVAEPVPAGSGATISLGGAAPVPLASLPVDTHPREAIWYTLPVTRHAVEGAREPDGRMTVVVRRDAGDASPVQICGGRDDPTRPGVGGASRWEDGQWAQSRLADAPLPLVEGRPAPARYYVELRLLDTQGLPTVGIWW